MKKMKIYRKEPFQVFVPNGIELISSNDGWIVLGRAKEHRGLVSFYTCHIDELMEKDLMDESKWIDFTLHETRKIKEFLEKLRIPKYL